MLKKIILCADDFGQNDPISTAIISLVKEERLSAVSCLSTEKDWQTHGPLLKELSHKVDIGLHFNLTHGQGNFASLNHWILKSLTRQVDSNFIKKTLHEQLDKFESVMQRAPDFIDGHQHVHSFPVIREAFAKTVKERYPNTPPYIRAITPLLGKVDRQIKPLILRGISQNFTKTLNHNMLPHNKHFAGVYSLTPTAPYRDLMRSWLKNAQTGTLIMCHPGATTSLPDSIKEARVQEYQYLSSNAFQEDCAQAHVCLARFKDCVF